MQRCPKWRTESFCGGREGGACVCPWRLLHAIAAAALATIALTTAALTAAALATIALAAAIYKTHATGKPDSTTHAT